MNYVVLLDYGMRRTVFYILGQGMLQSSAATSSSTIVTQTTIAPSPPPTSTPHPPTPHSSAPHPSIPNTHHPTTASPTTHPTPPVSSAHVPIYAKPRLLPSPYGPPPLAVTTSTETSGAPTGNGRSSNYRAVRNPPPKKVIPVSILGYI